MHEPVGRREHDFFLQQDGVLEEVFRYAEGLVDVARVAMELDHASVGEEGDAYLLLLIVDEISEGALDLE
jgi:hypothetical protein